MFMSVDEQTKLAARENMVSSADSVFILIDLLRLDQRERLLLDIKNLENTQVIQDTLSQYEDVNRLTKWMLQMINEEKTYILTNNPENEKQVKNLLPGIYSLLDVAKFNSYDPELAAQLEEIIGQVKEFETNFSTYISAVESQQQEEIILLEEAKVLKLQPNNWKIYKLKRWKPQPILPAIYQPLL